MELLDLGIKGIPPVKLCDVADVAIVDNSADTYCRVNGNNGVVLTVQKQNNYSTAGGCLLFLWDNGAALHFAGTTGSADARNAVEPLLEEGLSPLLDTSLHDSSGAVQRQSAVFTLNEYRCHAALLPRGTAGSYHKPYRFGIRTSL